MRASLGGAAVSLPDCNEIIAEPKHQESSLSEIQSTISVSEIKRILNLPTLKTMHYYKWCWVSVTDCIIPTLVTLINRMFFLKNLSPTFHNNLECVTAERNNLLIDLQTCNVKSVFVHINANICRSIDAHLGVAVVLLDLSAAFDTIDHNIFLITLRTRFVITGTALKWIRSYTSVMGVSKSLWTLCIRILKPFSLLCH